jgi:hypothetical protein
MRWLRFKGGGNNAPLSCADAATIWRAYAKLLICITYA